MNDGPHIARIAALIGERARASMLSALMADRALTATELAALAGITKQTASAHLGQLVEAQLLAVESQGRHRYYRLADPDVAGLLESLMGVAFRAGAVRLRSSPREPAMRKARVCYDHLAGELAVQAYDSALMQGWLMKHEGTLHPSELGWAAFARIGVNATLADVPSRRPMCRACLDWSERRHHLAGTLGAALLSRLLGLGWARRAADSRVVTFTAVGERNFLAWIEPAGGPPSAAARPRRVGSG